MHFRRVPVEKCRLASVVPIREGGRRLSHDATNDAPCADFGDDGEVRGSTLLGGFIVAFALRDQRR